MARRGREHLRRVSERGRGSGRISSDLQQLLDLQITLNVSDMDTEQVTLNVAELVVGVKFVEAHHAVNLVDSVGDHGLRHVDVNRVTEAESDGQDLSRLDGDSLMAMMRLQRRQLDEIVGAGPDRRPGANNGSAAQHSNTGSIQYAIQTATGRGTTSSRVDLIPTPVTSDAVTVRPVRGKFPAELRDA